MVAALSLPGAIGVDVAAWLALHVGVGYLVHRIPDRLLERDGWLFRERALERGGLLYVDALGIKKWKRHLPEGGDFFRGGFDKSRLATFDDAHLRAHQRETRRAELGHWLTMLPAPLFFLWNPWYAAVVVQGYAVAVNWPCIAAQRYNRIRLQRLLARRAASRVQSPPQRNMADR